MSTTTHDFSAEKSASNLLSQVMVLGLGTFFGIVLVKSEVVSWFRIQAMFRFEEAHMYLIITSAIIVGAISLQIIKRRHMKTVWGTPPEIKEKSFTKGTVIGGTLFGLGWAITGACPGPIYAQIGSGHLLALITFAGAMGGMFLYAFLEPYFPE